MQNSAPFGDVFYVQTPTLDRWSQQLYQEQKIRQARQQQEDAALDANIQKEIGKVRSVDTPEVIQAYQDYKRGKMQLLRDKKLQQDPLAFNQAQNQVLQNYQKIFTTANKSAELKDMQKQLTTDRIKNPNAYADDFGERMATLINTPISAVGKHQTYGDLTNWDNYKYQGSNTDWSKIVNDAAGKTTKMAGQIVALPGGLQTSTPIYEFGNTPAQIKDNILGAMAVHQTGRDAAYTWDHLPEQDIANTIKDFQAIPKEDWQKMGLQGPQDILPKNPDNKAENLASYYAMKHFIANRPRLVENKLQDNKKALEDLKWNRELLKLKIQKGNAEDLIRLRKSINPNDTEMNNTWVEGYLKQGIDNARADNNNLRRVYTPHTSQLAHELKGDVVLNKALTRGKSEPDKIYVTEDGKIWPIFYKYGPEKDKSGNVIKGTSVVMKNEKGDAIVDEDYSQPMTIDQAKLALGYKGQTKKQLEGTMKGGNKKESVTTGNKVEDLRKKYNY